MMKQQNMNQSYRNSDQESSKQQNNYNNSTNCSNNGSVEPLPESSRPRRDGPGGEDAK